MKIDKNFSTKKEGIITFIFIIFIILGYFLFFPEKIKKLKPLEILKKEIFTPGPLTNLIEREVKKPLSDDEIIKITNEYREKEGIESLKMNEILMEAAREKINDMLEKQYFAHFSPTGKGVQDFLKEVNYLYLSAGENLASGFFKDSRELVNAWMNSPGHRKNILNSKFKEIGVVQVKDNFLGQEQYLAVQIFATPQSYCPFLREDLKSLIEEKKEKINEKEKIIYNLIERKKILEEERERTYLEGKNLIKEGENLINEGNELIKKGNEISSKEEAEILFQQGEELQKKGKEKIDQGLAKNLEIEKINLEIKELIENYKKINKELDILYLELENLISQYNKGVRGYNECLESLK